MNTVEQQLSDLQGESGLLATLIADYMAHAGENPKAEHVSGVESRLAEIQQRSVNLRSECSEILTRLNSAKGIMLLHSFLLYNDYRI